jgi:rhodanese-related sulfurtransferase
MWIAALVVAAVALLVALVALSRSGGGGQRIEEVSLEAKRRAENLGEETERALNNVRQLLALVAEGGRPSREMILEGRLWQDIEPADAKRLLESETVRVIDVRTPQETASGIIPGALLLPIDALEARIKEVPRDGRKTLIYCAGGGRSAAACEFLSGEGFSGLLNLSGGFQSWSGAVERPGKKS